MTKIRLNRSNWRFKMVYRQISSLSIEVFTRNKSVKTMMVRSNKTFLFIIRVYWIWRYMLTFTKMALFRPKWYFKWQTARIQNSLLKPFRRIKRARITLYKHAHDKLDWSTLTKKKQFHFLLKIVHFFRFVLLRRISYLNIHCSCFSISVFFLNLSGFFYYTLCIGFFDL